MRPLYLFHQSDLDLLPFDLKIALPNRLLLMWVTSPLSLSAVWFSVLPRDAYA